MLCSTRRQTATLWKMKKRKRCSCRHQNGAQLRKVTVQVVCELTVLAGHNNLLFFLEIDPASKVHSCFIITSYHVSQKKVTVQVGNVNKALGSVSKMVRNVNKVMFDTTGSYNEKHDDERRVVAPIKRGSVRRGHDGGTARKRTEEKSACKKAAHVAWLVKCN